MLFSDDVFPFRFGFDRQLVVREVGRSLAKLTGGFQVGASLAELVALQNPTAEFDFEQLRGLVGSPVEMTVLGAGIRFRGQLVEREDWLYVIGAPQFETLTAYEQSGLALADFAAHDTTVETLVLRTHNEPRRDVGPADPASLLERLCQTNIEQRRLASTERSLQQALHAAADLLLRLDAKAIILEARASREDLLPCPPQGLVGSNVYESYVPIARPLRDAMAQLDSTEDSVPFHYKIVQGATISYLDARITSTSAGETLLLARDVTAQRQMKLELEHQATHDCLTDLPNRTRFDEEVRQALAVNAMVAVLFLDLDGFKLINDRHGHQLGDEVLVHVASTLRRCIGHSDVAARFGGDEFAILLKGIKSRQAAETVARELIDELMRPARIGHRDMATSVSIGIATSYDAQDATTLFQFADIAMYEAKARDKCCFESFRPSMYAELIRRDTLQQQLVAAGARGQFVNHYQPIVNVHSHHVVAFEALTRWQHPIRGLLMPEEFMSIAEESDAIVRVGQQAVENACQAMLQWQARVPVHFNVATRQLRKSSVATFLARCIDQYGVPASRLTAEINERTLQHDFDLASREIDQLCELGVNVALDEFGAGNYSLAFIERLPIQCVKLAKTLVHELGRSRQKDQLVKSVVQLVQTFGLDVIAAGVETQVQQDLLADFGCTASQGRLYSAPMTDDEVAGICLQPQQIELSPIADLAEIY